MVKKSDFSKEEWQLLTDGPEWVFQALAAADGNVALTTKGKETKAFKTVLDDYRSRSELVAEVLGDNAKASKEIKTATLSDAEQALEEINDLLDKKASSAEATDYRKFLTSIAESVAEAAGEGTLGVGKKLSAKESKALDKIKAALKPGRTPAAKPASKPVAKPAKGPIKPAKQPAKPTAGQPAEPVLPKREPQAAKAEPKVIAVHTLKNNETWSHLALKYYGHTTEPYWRYMYEFNKEMVGDNYKRIWDGMEIRIPELPDHLKDKE